MKRFAGYVMPGLRVEFIENRSDYFFIDEIDLTLPVSVESCFGFTAILLYHRTAIFLYLKLSN